MIVCVTGKIGTGKSTISKILAKLLQAKVIDVDKVGHEVLEFPEVKEKLLLEFGNEIFENGKINRKKLGAIVFSDPSKLRRLEEILHPKMREIVMERVKSSKNAIIDCALLKRMELEGICDIVITAIAGKETARKRKPHIKDELFEKIWKSQQDIIPMGILINTERPLQEIEKEIVNLLKKQEGKT